MKEMYGVSQETQIETVFSQNPNNKTGEKIAWIDIIYMWLNF